MLSGTWRYISAQLAVLRKTPPRPTSHRLCSSSQRRRLTIRSPNSLQSPIVHRWYLKLTLYLEGERGSYSGPSYCSQLPPPSQSVHSTRSPSLCLLLSPSMTDYGTMGYNVSRIVVRGVEQPVDIAQAVSIPPAMQVGPHRSRYFDAASNSLSDPLQAYKRGVLKAAPKEFTVTPLPPAKHGTHIPGSTIAPYSLLLRHRECVLIWHAHNTNSFR